VSEATTDPPRRPPPAARALVTIGKLAFAVGKLVEAVSSVNNALHGAIDQFSAFHGERKAQESIINGKLDVLLKHLGAEYNPPPPDSDRGPTRNGNGHTDA